MARRIPPAPPANPEPDPAGRTDADFAARNSAAPEEPAEREPLKLVSLSRLDVTRPPVHIDGTPYPFANPIALSAHTRHRLGELYSALTALGDIDTPEKSAEKLGHLLEIATIAVPTAPAEVLRDLGDIQLDALTGAFFVDAAGSLPTKLLVTALGLNPENPIGAMQFRGSKGSTAGTRRRGSKSPSRS